MVIKVEVFGVDPPCIRCHRTYKLAEEAAKMFEGKVEVEHHIFTSDRAKAYGVMKTGGEIAQMKGIKLDDRIVEIADKLEGVSSEDEEALEKEISPIAEIAGEAGILMTPVLAVNGKVRIAGRVPTKEEIIGIIKEELDESKI